MASYLLTFHCGATMVVEDSPVLTDEMRREHADIKKSELRGGCLRVITRIYAKSAPSFWVSS